MPEQIYTALHAVSNDMLEGVAKLRKSPQYTFRGVEDLQVALAPSLAKNRIILIPEVLDSSLTVESKEKDRYKESDPIKIQRITKAKVLVKFTCMSIVDGSKVVATMLGEGEDYGDKATPKAISMAWKYLVTFLFCIPTENVADNVVSEDEHPGVDRQDYKEEELRLLKAIMDAKTIERMEALQPYAVKFNVEDAFNEAMAKLERDLRG